LADWNCALLADKEAVKLMSILCDMASQGRVVFLSIGYSWMWDVASVDVALFDGTF